ncbi:MAG: polysaccharide biosynthesis C-terminal domain-containing protein, partial [Clostridia bacterium]|nr:polysaccharide biosynthesis C-terminal domain-containing protein [Clostridia bacterium]
ASATAVGYTVDFLRYCMPFLCLNIIANMFHHFFRGIGHMKALLITTVTGSIARIIISWLFIPIIGIYGYYIGWVVSWLFDGFAGVIIYFFGKWRKEIKYT